MKNTKRILAMLLVVVSMFSLFAACASKEEDVYGLVIEMDMEEVPLAAGAPVSATNAKATGTDTKGNAKATIDYSNAADGYVLVKYTGSYKNVKVQITGPSKTAYTYSLNTKGDYEVFPFSDGNGDYKIGVYENNSGTKYATAYSCTVKVNLEDEFAPFLNSNQYVNYDDSEKLADLSDKVAGDKDTDVEKIEAIYKYVVKNFKYDYDLADTVKSGYLPVLDTVIANKKGICFDYAALMTAMLRYQGIPTKLVVGYTGDVYHAWISTYSEESGWVDTSIYFDGAKWKLMDPTFASTGNSSKSVMSYIGDGKNYTAKYIY